MCVCAAWAQRRREAPPNLLGGRFGDCDNFNFDSLDFTGDIFNMFGSAASGSGSGGGAGSGGMFAAAPPTGKGKLEARLLALLMQAGVEDALLDKIGESGMNTVALYANMASDEDRFKVVIAMDEIGVKGDSFNGMLNQSKLVGIWRSLRTTAEVEDKAAANRAQLALPPVVTTKDIKGLTKIFQATAEGYEVEKHECPSKDYFAKKCAQIESSFEAEHLTQVTNSHCDAPEADIPDGQLAGFDMVQKTFRIANKEVRVSMPRDPEILRARFKTMGLCWVYLKLKYPSKEVLRTATIKLFDDYVKWLFGKHVWGNATLGHDGKPIATPSIDHVLVYDNAVRARVIDNMNSGMDIRSAFGEATAHEPTRQVHFYGVIQCDTRPRTVTAPGLAASLPVADVPTGPKGTTSLLWNSSGCWYRSWC